MASVRLYTVIAEVRLESKIIVWFRTVACAFGYLGVIMQTLGELRMRDTAKLMAGLLVRLLVVSR